MDFMGTRVSYPQYLRLVAIQREVIRMDVTIRSMLQTYDPMELSQNPYWMELLQLYNSLKKMLPEKYNQGSQKEISDQKEISQAILPLMYEEAEKAVV